MSSGLVSEEQAVAEKANRATVNVTKRRRKNTSQAYHRRAFGIISLLASAAEGPARDT